MASAQSAYAEALGALANGAGKCDGATKATAASLAEIAQLMGGVGQHHKQIVANFPPPNRPSGLEGEDAQVDWFGADLLKLMEKNVGGDPAIIQARARAGQEPTDRKGPMQSLWKDVVRGDEGVGWTAGDVREARLGSLTMALSQTHRRYDFLLERHVSWLRRYLSLAQKVTSP